MRLFSLYRRSGIYYVQFHNPETGLRLPGKSTGMRSRDEAIEVLSGWKRDGIPQRTTLTRRTVGSTLAIDSALQFLKTHELQPDDVRKIVQVLMDRGLLSSASQPQGKVTTVSEFLEEFWDYDHSPYVREKVAHGHRIGRRHCQDSLAHIRRYWTPLLGSKELTQLSRQDLKAFALGLKERTSLPPNRRQATKLAAATINLIMVSGTTALSWAFLNGLIPSDPTDGLLRFSGQPEKRGIPTEHEARQLFTVPWKEERSRVANLLSMTTGMRSGEVLALRPEDIGEDRLFVRYSWSPTDGLKAPKNGETRIVHLLPVVREYLVALVESNPHQERKFVFYSAVPTKPMDKNFLLFGLADALEKIGVDKAEKSKRNLCFHSWRHYFATQMANRVGELAMKLTGHKTEAVFENYANHANEKDFLELSVAAESAFGLDFPQISRHLINSGV